MFLASRHLTGTYAAVVVPTCVPTKDCPLPVFLQDIVERLHLWGVLIFIIVEDMDSSASWRPCSNVSPQPHRHFSIHMWLCACVHHAVRVCVCIVHVYTIQHGQAAELLHFANVGCILHSPLNLKRHVHTSLLVEVHVKCNVH